MRHLWGDYTPLCELRLIHASGRVVRRLVTWPFGDDVYEFLRSHNSEGYNVYIGVAERTAGKELGKVPAAWCDIDAYKGTAGLMDNKDRVFLELLAAEPRPSMIVDSGHGIHGYWVLTEPTMNHKSVVASNRIIANRFGGDRVHDVARIMRLPGFCNVKQDPLPVRILYTNDRKYELQDLLAQQPRVPDRLADLIYEGNNGRYPSRSEADFAVVINLLRLGYSDEDIIAMFEENKIGEKYREAGERYLRLTIDNAKRRLEEESNKCKLQKMNLRL